MLPFLLNPTVAFCSQCKKYKIGSDKHVELAGNSIAQFLWKIHLYIFRPYLKCTAVRDYI